MLTRIALLALAITLLAGVVGCKNVTSSRPPNTSVTGEAWYVKSTWFMINWKTAIFYCPKPTSPGPATCIQAIVHEEGEMPAGGGFGQPAPPPQPAPAQPAPGGYGQPAQPAPGGFGQPAQPAPGGFGAPPPAPAPQPGAPGYQPTPAPSPPPPPPPSY
jgi:hypothetical protein